MVTTKIFEQKRGAIKSCYSCHSNCKRQEPPSPLVLPQCDDMNTQLKNVKQLTGGRTDMHSIARFRGQSITANSTQTSTCALPNLPSSDSLCNYCSPLVFILSCICISLANTGSKFRFSAADPMQSNMKM